MTDVPIVTSREEAPGVVVCSVTGDIDARTAPEVQAGVLAHLQQGTSVVLDLTAVAYTSSAGLRMLLLLHRHAMANGARLVLAGLHEDVASVMSATGFLEAFERVDTADEGVRSLT